MSDGYREMARRLILPKAGDRPPWTDFDNEVVYNTVEDALRRVAAAAEQRGHLAGVRAAVARMEEGECPICGARSLPKPVGGRA